VEDATSALIAFHSSGLRGATPGGGDSTCRRCNSRRASVQGGSRPRRFEIYATGPAFRPSDLGRSNGPAGRQAKSGIVFPDADGCNANADDAPLVHGVGWLNKRRAATIRINRLEPLLTVAQAAMILSVSERTVRRLVASGTIRGIWIGRSVRLRPREIEQWIAGGGTCND
jgi:excisionase family DNA binding protein